MNLLGVLILLTSKSEDEELKARRTRIENAADIAAAVSSALEALDASRRIRVWMALERRTA